MRQPQQPTDGRAMQMNMQSPTRLPTTSIVHAMQAKKLSACNAAEGVGRCLPVHRNSVHAGLTCIERLSLEPTRLRRQSL